MAFSIAILPIEPALSQSSPKSVVPKNDNSPPVIIRKEADFNAKKQEEKENHIYGDGLSVSEIVTYVEKMRPRLRSGKYIDITKKFKRFSSVVRKVGKNYIRVLNLDDASFSGDDMSRTSFALSSLKNTNFAGANLQNTVFAYADLQHANFSGANLKGADFSHANLLSANFTGANLDGTNFYQAEIESIKAATPKDIKKIKDAVGFYRVQ